MEDLSLLNYDKKTLKINKPIRLIELFGGIGSQAKALERIGADFEHYRVCEFDKYAIASYNAIHGTDFAVSDITQITADDLGIVDTDKYCYMMTYSFPCQDLSLAGKQKGMAKGENTRSGLLWEVERLLNGCSELPQVLLMENVTQVHGKKNVEHFNEWIKFLESKGYSNYWKDLNSKNFGIPQNRNRTFMVSVLGNYTYEFPEEFPLELRLKDMLEETVDEKFYVSNALLKQIKMPVDVSGTRYGRVSYDRGFEDTGDVASALCARDFKGMGKYKAINAICENTEIAKSVISAINGDIAKTIRAGGRGSVDRHSWDLVAEPKSAFEPNTCLIQPKDRDYKKKNQPREVHIESKNDGVSHALRTKGETMVAEPQTQLRIRKLTPKETWRLMGFDDEDFEKAAQHNSNSQLYKQAGNSIVVDVLAHIFTQML